MPSLIVEFYLALSYMFCFHFWGVGGRLGWGVRVESIPRLGVSGGRVRAQPRGPEFLNTALDVRVVNYSLQAPLFLSVPFPPLLSPSPNLPPYASTLHLSIPQPPSPSSQKECVRGEWVAFGGWGGHGPRERRV